jgi:ketosteroid isomerase-like protein
VDQIGDAWAEFRMEPEELFERDDLVVVLVRAVGTGRESGVEIDSPVAVVCEMREGKIAVLRVEPDREAALAQVGR